MNHFRPTGSGQDMADAFVIEPHGNCFALASLFVRAPAQTVESAPGLKSGANGARYRISGCIPARRIPRHQSLRLGPTEPLLCPHRRLTGGACHEGGANAHTGGEPAFRVNRTCDGKRLFAPAWTRGMPPANAGATGSGAAHRWACSLIVAPIRTCCRCLNYLQSTKPPRNWAYLPVHCARPRRNMVSW